MNAIDYFRSIDGNWIRKPVGYCTYHRGYVSERQAKVHRCHRKHGGTCGRLKDMEGRYIKKMRTDQYYDKMISRMDKMCGTLEKIVRTLGAIQEAEAMMPLEKVLKEAQSMTDMEYLFGKTDNDSE